MKPWGAYTLTSAKEEICPLSTTLCFRFLKKLNKFKMLSDIPFCLSGINLKFFKIQIHLMIYGIFFIQRRTKR